MGFAAGFAVGFADNAFGTGAFESEFGKPAAVGVLAEGGAMLTEDVMAAGGAVFSALAFAGVTSSVKGEALAPECGGEAKGGFEAANFW